MIRSCESLGCFPGGRNMDMHSAASAAAEGLLGVQELSSDTTAERGLTAIVNQTEPRPHPPQT